MAERPGARTTRRPEPAREEAASPVQSARSAGRARGAADRRVLLVAAFVVGVVRPWDLAGPAPRPGPAARAPARLGRGVAPGTRRRADASAPDGPAGAHWPSAGSTCGYPSGWRAATLQRWAGRERPIRSWIAVDPVAPAARPDDPAIPFAAVADRTVLAIGYCAPVDGEQRPPSAVDVEVCRAGGRAPRRLEGLVRRLEPPAAERARRAVAPGRRADGPADGDLGAGPLRDPSSRRPTDLVRYLA